MTAQKRFLGEDAFLVKEDGTMMRTIVSALNLQEMGYNLLYHARFEYFDFSAAVAKSNEILIGREKKLREELATVLAQIALNGSAEHYKELLDTPLIKASTTSFLQDKPIEVLEIPKKHWMPGQVVYGVVGLKTHTGSMGKHSHHVVETTVSEVRLDNGFLQYFYSNYYNFPSNCVFTDIEAAKKRLVEVFANETGGTLPLEAVKVEFMQKSKVASTEQPDGAYLTNELDSPAFRGD